MDKKALISEIKTLFQAEFRKFEEKISDKYDAESKELRKSMEYMSDSFETQRKLFEETNTQNKLILQQNKELSDRVQILEYKINIMEQKEKRNNIIVTGIPVQQNKTINEVVSSLFHGMGIVIKQDDILDCYRLKTDKENKPIVIKFKSFETKSEIYKRRKIIKNIYTKDCNFQGSNKQIYINDELTKYHQELFKEVRDYKKKLNYKSAFYLHGKIYLKKKDDSVPIKVLTRECLKKIAVSSSL